MALGKTIQQLSFHLGRLHTAWKDLCITVTEDQPRANTAAVVEKLGAATEDLRGMLEEMQATVADAVRAVSYPLDLERAYQALIVSQDRFHLIRHGFYNELISYENLSVLSAFASERAGEWPGWIAMVKSGLEDCREAMEKVDRSLAESWQEVAEKLLGVSLVTRVATASQQIMPIPGVSEIEGRVESIWKPRSFGSPSDLSGGVTGAQASIYSRAREFLNQALPLLDGLKSLNSKTSVEDVNALKAVVQTQMVELTKELGAAGGPRVPRVNLYFSLLLGGTTFPISPSPAANTPLLSKDARQIGGTLGKLRDELGLTSAPQNPVNTVDDEQNITNFRVLSDYITSLAQSWINNLTSFERRSTTPSPGTQLLLLSRQLSNIVQAVDEVRFTMDSVFVSPAERRAIVLNFSNSADPPMLLEDLLAWISNFASAEGPALIQEGGKFGVSNGLLPITTRLTGLLGEIADSDTKSKSVPAPFHTPQVQASLRRLTSQLRELKSMATSIERTSV